MTFAPDVRPVELVTVPPLPGPELLRLLGASPSPSRPLERAAGRRSSINPTGA